MRKIRKKASGPTLRDSWIMIPIGIAVVAVIVGLVYFGSKTGRRAPPAAGWTLVAGTAAPVLDGLGEPAMTLEPRDFSQAVASEGPLLSSGGALWLLVYELGEPPVRAEVMFFRDLKSAEEYVKKIPALEAREDPEVTLGDESFAGPDGRLVMRRGGVLARVRPGADSAAPPVEIAGLIDRAIQRSFGANP